ncbi:MAG: CBS domain-containing protein [Desulfopila sp.]|jgi:CBS domain-containing protein|nr:CBS domain-containing protein [Desulfopila sp.]
MATSETVVRARDIMRTDVYYIDGMATVIEAAAIMRKEKVTSLIVEKRSVDDAWGMVVAQDIVRGVFIENKKPETLHVFEIMSKPVVAVPPDMDVRYVARLMNRVGVHRLPVDDNGSIVGIVLQADLILKEALF